MDPERDGDAFRAKVDELHEQYLDAIRQMHAQHAPIYGNENEQELEIWSPADVRDPNSALILHNEMMGLPPPAIKLASRL